MRILLVNDYRETIGGAEVYIHELVKELTQRGHRVEIFTSDITHEGYSHRTKHISLRNYALRLFNFSAYKSIKLRAAKFNPDIIHIHGIFNELSPAVVYALRNYPIIMTVHNNQLLSPLPISISKNGVPCKQKVCPGCLNCIGWKGMIYEFIKLRVHSFLLFPIKLYICPSNYMSELLRQHGFKNVTRLANGIKPLEYKPIKNFDTLLFIGQLIKEKGVEVLIQAMSEVVKKKNNVKLIIAGEGSEKQSFIKLVAELQLEGHIDFIGKTQRENLNDLYSKVAFVVVPSIFPDNFPTVCLESMSAGRPVVGTAIGGIPEIIEEGKTGFLVEVNNPVSLAEKILKLITDNQLLTNMSLHTKEVSTQYSFSVHIAKLETIYKRFLNKA